MPWLRWTAAVVLSWALLAGWALYQPAVTAVYAQVEGVGEAAPPPAATGPVEDGGVEVGLVAEEVEGELVEFRAWERLAEDWELPEEMRLENLKRFGEALFARAEGEEPRLLNMPVSPQYIVGPGDELTIRVWGEGIEHLNTTALISSEGMIYLPLLGEISVAGKALGVVRDTIEKGMSAFYTASQTSVVISSTRVVTVYVTGDVINPGRYGLDGTATVLTALYMAGGPTAAGSLRRIRLIRRQQEPIEIDLYPYLLAGEPLDEVLLETGDTVFVGAVGDEIGVAGVVRRPRRYEVTGPVNCWEAIKLAGGLAAEGSRKDVRVWRVDDHQRQVVINVALAEAGADGGDLVLQTGDVVVVAPVDRMPENAARISGAVRRAGVYEVEEGMTIGALIAAAGGLDEGAYLGYGQIRRLDERRQHHYESFSVQEALDKRADSVVVKPYDAVYLYYRQDVTPITYVRITGPVANPGEYEWVADMRVRDLVVQSGGVTDDAYLAQGRLLRLEPDGDRSILKIELQKALADAPESNRRLEPGDILEVIPRGEPRMVHVAGLVREPGDYERFEGMRASDLIFAAGGLAPGAGDTVEYARGWQTGMARIQELKLHVGPGSQFRVEPDVVLGNDDQIALLGLGDFWEQPPVVRVEGQVEKPGAYILLSSAKKDETLYDLLQRAGPLLDNANPDGIIIYRPSERALATGQRQNLEQIVAMYNREAVRAAVVEEGAEAEHAVMTEQVAANVGQVLAGDGGLAIVVPPRRLSLSAWVTGIPVEGSRLLESNGVEENVPLRSWDTIVVPELQNTVAVLGAVIRPGKVPYREEAGIDQYIGMVGGVADDADVRRAVVVRANSAAYRRDRVKEIRPGDVIIVPSHYMVRTVRTDTTLERVLRALGSVAATFLVLN